MAQKLAISEAYYSYDVYITMATTGLLNNTSCNLLSSFEIIQEEKVKGNFSKGFL